MSGFVQLLAWDGTNFQRVRCDTAGNISSSSTTGGLSVFTSLDLDETEEAVKTSAGQVYGWWVMNLRTSNLYLKFYNDTVANVVVGTTVPHFVIPVPSNATDDIAGQMQLPAGIAFSTAITVAATTGFANNDTGAPGTNEMIISVFYK